MFAGPPLTHTHTPSPKTFSEVASLILHMTNWRIRVVPSFIEKRAPYPQMSVSGAKKDMKQEDVFVLHLQLRCGFATRNELSTSSL